MRLTHFINLPCLGGIEKLFIAFIESDIEDIEYEILSNGDIDISVANRIKGFRGNIRNYKKWGNLRIPGWPRNLRKWRLNYKVSRSPAPDILLLWSQLSSWEIAQVYKKRGSKIIYYEHGSAWLCSPSPERLAFLRDVDGIICASRACARMLVLRWQVPEEKITICTNPLLPELVPPLQLTKKPIKSGRPIQLGVAGRLVAMKGFGIVINTLNILLDRGIDCELKIAGSGAQEADLKSLAKKLGVEHRVKFLGFTVDMGIFFGSIDIFICPSLREPFGLVSIEASAWGCAVVAANVDGLSETMLDGVTGCLVAPSMDPSMMKEIIGDDWPEYVYDPISDSIVSTLAIDPNNLAGAIVKMINNREKLADMKEKGAQFAAEKFCYDVYLRNFISTLRKIREQ